MPEHFAGIVAGEAVHEGHFRDIVTHLKSGTTEVMMHPGTDNQVLMQDCLWQHDFEAELSAIVSPAIQKLLQEKQVKVVNFRDLK